MSICVNCPFRFPIAQYPSIAAGVIPKVAQSKRGEDCQKAQPMATAARVWLRPLEKSVVSLALRWVRLMVA